MQIDCLILTAVWRAVLPLLLRAFISVEEIEISFDKNIFQIVSKYSIKYSNKIQNYFLLLAEVIFYITTT